MEQLEPLFVAAVFDAADERDTGVVHQRVEPARDALNFFERLLNAVTRAYVGLDKDFGAASGSLPQVKIEDRGALSIQEPADSLANSGAAARAGDPQAARQRSGWCWERGAHAWGNFQRSEEHTSELQSLMRNSYADC